MPQERTDEMPTTVEQPFRASRYTTGAILLHWTIALLVLGQIASGYLMTDVFEDGSTVQYNAFQLHKSFGVSVLVLTVARILWRLFNPPPPEPVSVGGWERRAASVVHHTFYVLLLAVPLAGWLTITVARVRIDTELFFADWLPWPHLPGFAGLSEGSRGEIEDVAEEVHAILAWSMGALVALHVAGAVKHHLADGGFIGRMAAGDGRGDGPRNSYGHATTWLVTVSFFAAMLGAAAWARRDEPVPATRAVSPDQQRILATASPAETSARSEAETSGEPGVRSGALLWSVVAQESRVGFTFGYGDTERTGAIGTFDATIRFDPQDLAGSSIVATLDLGSASIDGETISDAQLKGPDGLSVGSDPVATFRSTSIRATGEGTYAADGTLDFRAAAVPVALPFTLAIDGTKATAKASVTLDRLDYGVGAQSDPEATTLSPRIDVTAEIVALKGEQGD